jgi:hypothetical protein
MHNEQQQDSSYPHLPPSRLTCRKHVSPTSALLQAPIVFYMCADALPNDTLSCFAAQEVMEVCACLRVASTG